MQDGQRLQWNEKQQVQYAIPLWLRDEQVRQSTARIKGRIAANYDKRKEPVAVVCFGPSLNDTWERVKRFKHVISCSGAHKFLRERGIIPTWHVEVDPREHKVSLMGEPCHETEYLIASTCHAKLFDHLEGFNVKLWHVFEAGDEGLRKLPQGEWALTGGSSVGLRAMSIARFLGFTDLHVFGMDGCEGKTGKHAAEHPSQPKGFAIVEYKGKEYRTTPSMLECARQTWHELNQMRDVKARFYGRGLVQAMARDYKPEPVDSDKALIGFIKPELISAEYRELNRRLHHDNLAYGVGGGKHAETVLKIAKAIDTKSVLDYGCGKSYLAKALPFPIWEYDPAVPGKEEAPRPADLVVCTDVLEHIEPEKLPYVLDDIRRCVRKVGFLVIDTEPSTKSLADGRNAHLILRPSAWWAEELGKFFTVGKLIQKGRLIHAIVGPKVGKAKKPKVSVVRSAA